MTTHSDVAPVLNPPVRVLLGPGPSDVHPRVLSRAGAAGRSGIWIPYYLQLMNDMQQMLRRCFARGTK